MNKWKDIDEERPKIGAKCIVIDKKGRMSMKTYCHYKIRIVSRTGLKLVQPIDDERAPEGFVSDNGRLDDKALYYTELPEVPSKVERALKIKEKIERLKEELESL